MKKAKRFALAFAALALLTAVLFCPAALRAGAAVCRARSITGTLSSGCSQVRSSS